ncbi:MAG: tetratricopeptide repeat protein [Bacteroidia bacterium]
MKFTGSGKFSFATLLIAGILLLSFYGCSRKKNNFFNRAWHNTTSHYNGYFNGREALKEGVATLENTHTDDYDKILEIFQTGAPEQASSINPNADKAIKKASLMISRHSMLIKGKEYCRWIDDCYMLIGKSHHYKKDFYPAAEIFNYVIKQYQDKPATVAEGRIWLLRNYTAMNRLTSAQGVIDNIEADIEVLPEKQVGHYAAAYADFLIKKEEYANAIPQLEKAIANTKNKRLVTRYTYILAQLYEKVNDKSKASLYYAQVLKKNATYDMAFNAQINLALMFDATAGGSSADLKKTLRKMSRDDKNIEYLDRIYYALAGIAISESEYDEAIKLLKQSVLASTSNTKQKGLSYLKLADLYFDKPEYETSKYYYDSTLTALPQEHAEYFRAEAKRNSLEDLVKNLKTIAFEDSVQKLAKMSSTELDIYIDDMIAKIIEEEERKRFEEENAALNPINTNQNTNQNANQNTGGKWYFDNPTAVSFGYGEFARIWGNRKLEDNWRRKNKESVAPTMTENAVEDSLAAKKDTFDVKSKEYYLRNIPVTQAAMDSSNTRIIDAYYSLGMIYREQLDDKPRAIESFETLLKRYPNNKYTLASYYQLYRLNLAMNNNPRADYYRNLIIKEYPESEYANILQNPNYVKELQAFKGRAAEFYGETFAAYEAQDYDVVIQNANQAHIRFEKSDQLPRFDLLKAMAIGKTQKLDAFEAALKDLIAKYPKGEERKEAENILKYIEGVRGGADERLPEEKVLNIPVAIEQSLYRLNKDTVHYYVAVIGKMGFNNNPLKAKISDFNGQFYSLESLTIKNMMINPLSQLVYVEKFENAAKAKAYFETIKQKPEIFEGLVPEEYRQFIISAGNFNIYYKDKNIDKYLEFYNTNYANN